MKIVCDPKITFISWFGIIISLLEVMWDESTNKPICVGGSRFYVGCMRGTSVCNNFLRECLWEVGNFDGWASMKPWVVILGDLKLQQLLREGSMCGFRTSHSGCLGEGHWLHALVENYAKKNRTWSRLWFFWPTWYAIVKRLWIFLFHFCDCTFKNFGACNISLGKNSRHFPTVYYTSPHPPTPNISIAKPKKSNMESFSNCRAS